MYNEQQAAKEMARCKPMWGDGPWQQEPDQYTWIDENTGYVCEAQRSWRTGSWNGYVNVPSHNEYYGVRKLMRLNFSVHGGVTFADFKSDGFWIGFDAAHAYDVIPAFALTLGEWPAGCVYRDLEYIKTECAHLAGEIRGYGEPLDGR